MAYFVSGNVLDASGAPMAGVPVRVHSRTTGGLLASDVSSDGNPVVGDAHFADVVLLTDFENGLIDKSNYAHTLTLGGSAGVVTTQAAVGSTKSLSGTFTTPTAAEWALPGDFTIEMEFWVNSWSPGLQTLINIGSYGNFMLRLQSTILELWIGGSNPGFSLNGGATIPTNTWHHLAVTRASGVMRVWFNGVQVGADYSNAYSIPANAILVGASAHASASEYLNGFLDELRITKGVARYSANFTRPTAPHKAFANKPATPVGTFTVALGSNNPGEVQVVFLSPDVGGTHNDVVHRTTPYVA